MCILKTGNATTKRETLILWKGKAPKTPSFMYKTTNSVRDEQMHNTTDGFKFV